MNQDTIFPALSGGERIVGKYEDTDDDKSVTTSATITNLRLLIRQKQTTYCCCDRSNYSSIMLDSVDRIDETYLHQDWEIITYILLVLSGLGLIIYRFVFERDWLIFFGIALTIFSAGQLGVSCFYNKKKSIELKGSFGSETMIFKQAAARKFQEELSEMVYRARMQHSIRQSNFHESRLPLQLPIPIPSAPFMEPETIPLKAEKTFVYDPLANP